MKTASQIFLIIIATMTFRSAVAQKADKGLTEKLSRIYQADQRYRVKAIAKAKKNGSGSAKDIQLGKKQDALDLANLAEVEKIIQDYGYPGKTLVGAQSNVAFIVIQHNDLESQEKYLPLFIKAAEQGELERSLLPLMIDRIRVAKGQPQLYGTQLAEVRGSKKVQIKPIEEEFDVDMRRKSFGLGPLKDYYKNWGIDYKLPTREHNSNPKALYADLEAHNESRIEAIGGDNAIIDKIRYPQQARSSNITGQVTVEFTVDKDSKTKNIIIVKGLGYGCDEEAVRVISQTRYTNPEKIESELRMRLPFGKAKL